jgi:hypothetical protein
LYCKDCSNFVHGKASNQAHTISLLQVNEKTVEIEARMSSICAEINRGEYQNAGELTLLQVQLGEVEATSAPAIDAPLPPVAANGPFGEAHGAFADADAEHGSPATHSTSGEATCEETPEQTVLYGGAAKIFYASAPQ